MKNEEISTNTKKAFAASLKRAMKKKPFPKITVSELARDCGVNRNTFYYHFEDIYALLRWMLNEEAIKVVGHFDMMMSYEDAVFFVMDYVERNGYIISSAYDSIGYEEMRRFFYADIIRLTGSIIDGTAARMGVELDPEFRAFASRFYAEAFLGILIDWAKNGFIQSREKILSYLTMLLEGGMHPYLR